MIFSDREDPKKLWRRYLAAVILLAMVLIGGHVMHSRSLLQGAKDAEIIDLSGRQRMLSQRISALAADLDGAGERTARGALAEAAALFLASHEQLLEHAQAVPVAWQIYGLGQQDGLDANSRAFAADVDTILTTETTDASHLAALERVKAMAYQPLLFELDEAVKAFANIARLRLQRIERLQYVALVVGLMVLALEALLIFWPAQRTVVNALEVADARAKALLDKNRELRKLSDRLEHAAFHDQLTGLANRKRLHLELERRLGRSRLTSAGLCVMHLDLDRFKEINDTLGHAIGDEVLRREAEVMLSQVRSTDLVARVGGDEFVIVADLGDDDLDTRARLFAERLIACMRIPMVVDGHTCSVGASVGFAFADDCNRDALQMIGNADIALYEAKRAGKGIAVAFEASMRGGMEQRHALIQELEQALEVGEFIPYFQPKVALNDGRIIGFEVLMRWNHPKRGVLAPGEFLALAEETGLVEEIDRQAINGALDVLTAMRAEGWAVPTVAVNASTASLRNAEFAADLRMAVAMRGLSAADVRVEVVESTLISKDDDVALGVLRELVSDGFKIDLDDFGTGYASLATLARLDLAGLKIDRGLVKSLDHPRSNQIVQAVIGLAKGLDLEVVAEGVETPTQFAMLRRMGCDIAQGFSISKPIAKDDLGAWMSSYGRQPVGQRPLGALPPQGVPV